MILKTTKSFNFAVSEYGKYVDKFPLPLINVGRLSIELLPAKCCTLEIPTLKGVEERGTGKIVYPFLILCGKLFLNG